MLVVGCWTDDGQCPLDWWFGARNPGDAVLGEEEGKLPGGGGMAWKQRKGLETEKRMGPGLQIRTHTLVVHCVDCVVHYNYVSIMFQCT